MHKSSSSMVLISICCSYLTELVRWHRFKQDIPFERIFHGTDINSGLQAMKHYIALLAIMVYTQSSSVAFHFFGSSTFIYNYGFLEIRRQMTGQVAHCITKISTHIVFVVPMASSQAIFHYSFSFKCRN
jgi:hypothetical protein